jgi:hypothetical protein
LPITSINLHDLGDDEAEGDDIQVEEGDNAKAKEDPKVKEIVERTPVEILIPEAVQSLLLAPLPSPLIGCRLCQMVPNHFGARMELPKGSKEMIETHLSEE